MLAATCPGLVQMDDGKGQRLDRVVGCCRKGVKRRTATQSCFSNRVEVEKGVQAGNCGRKEKLKRS